MKFAATVASNVQKIPEKGTMFQVMVPDLGTTIGVFIPVDGVTSEDSLKMGDSVFADLHSPYPSGNQVKFKCDSVILRKDVKN